MNTTGLRYSSIFLAALAFSACQNTDSKNDNAKANNAAADTANYTTIQWIDSSKDVGTLVYGQQAKIEFQFKNTGTKPLYIISAQPGCGCTVADFPKEAIAPGQQGEIIAGFDTKKGGEGEFRKNIVVTTNTKNGTSSVLYFNGVSKKEGEQNSPPKPLPLRPKPADRTIEKPLRKLKNQSI